VATASARWRRAVQTVAAGAMIVGLVGAPRLKDPDPETAPAPRAETSHPDSRSLVPWYLSFASLQALDIESTARVINGGGREANPIVASVWQSPIGLTAVKAGATAGLIYAAQRLRKENPKAALLLMIGANSAMATIVAHNFAVAGGGGGGGARQ
jgi:uncharacterized protein DUF5658